MGEIVQYRSMRATEMSAQEAQSSADNMEALTDSMHDIASKTKRETVSMRVITSVTLFFLPGTFVAVWSLNAMPNSSSNADTPSDFDEHRYHPLFRRAGVSSESITDLLSNLPPYHGPHLSGLVLDG